MKRRQLFEFLDLSPIPALFKAFETDYLLLVSQKLRLHRPIVPYVKRLLEKPHAAPPCLIDLGSGSGGPAFDLQKELAQDGAHIHLFLTDLQPVPAHMRSATGEDATYFDESVAADHVPAHLKGPRTMLNVFHHLRPEEARRVLEAAMSDGQPIGIFEANERSVKSLLAMILIVPLLVVFMTPMIRPFSLRRLLFTYIVPVMPLMIAWDGFVSCLRTYMPEDLDALTDGLPGRWEKGFASDERGVRWVYCLGWPA